MMELGSPCDQRMWAGSKKASRSVIVFSIIRFGGAALHVVTRQAKLTSWPDVVADKVAG